MKFLLDTDSVSYFLRGEGHVAERLLAMPAPDVGLPAPVLYESRYGMRRMEDGRRRKRLLGALDELLRFMDVVPFDAAAAECAAIARADLSRRGVMVGSVDMQIAGIALAIGAALVTRNTREFARVDGVKFENWYDG